MHPSKDEKLYHPHVKQTQLETCQFSKVQLEHWTHSVLPQYYWVWCHQQCLLLYESLKTSGTYSQWPRFEYNGFTLLNSAKVVQFGPTLYEYKKHMKWLCLCVNLYKFKMKKRICLENYLDNVSLIWTYSSFFTIQWKSAETYWFDCFYRKKYKNSVSDVCFIYYVM